MKVSDLLFLSTQSRGCNVANSLKNKAAAPFSIVRLFLVVVLSSGCTFSEPSDESSDKEDVSSHPLARFVQVYSPFFEISSPDVMRDRQAQMGELKNELTRAILESRPWYSDEPNAYIALASAGLCDPFTGVEFQRALDAERPFLAESILTACLPCTELHDSAFKELVEYLDLKGKAPFDDSDNVARMATVHEPAARYLAEMLKNGRSDALNSIQVFRVTAPVLVDPLLELLRKSLTTEEGRKRLAEQLAGALALQQPLLRSKSVELMEIEEQMASIQCCKYARRDLLYMLSQLADENERILEVLVERTGDKEKEVRQGAIGSLLIVAATVPELRNACLQRLNVLAMSGAVTDSDFFLFPDPELDELACQSKELVSHIVSWLNDASSENDSEALDLLSSALNCHAQEGLPFVEDFLERDEAQFVAINLMEDAGSAALPYAHLLEGRLPAILGNGSGNFVHAVECLIAIGAKPSHNSIAFCGTVLESTASFREKEVLLAWMPSSEVKNELLEIPLMGLVEDDSEGLRTPAALALAFLFPQNAVARQYLDGVFGDPGSKTYERKEVAAGVLRLHHQNTEARRLFLETASDTRSEEAVKRTIGRLSSINRSVAFSLTLEIAFSSKLRPELRTLVFQSFLERCESVSPSKDELLDVAVRGLFYPDFAIPSAVFLCGEANLPEGIEEALLKTANQPGVPADQNLLASGLAKWILLRES